MTATARLPALRIDPELEAARKARWWAGWDAFRAGRPCPENIAGIEGWEAAQTAASLSVGRIFKETSHA